ncbi:MAG: protein kinase [Deltaproteobacteria bacterium]|nr:protein kinase [Deltaproteobacteria bacterium]
MTDRAPSDKRIDETDDPEVETPLRTGQRMGAWTLAERLGRGAAGEVYRAFDDEGQDVAIKLLRLDRRPERQELRFRRELRAISRLDHPHVLRVLGEGRSDEGHRFMVTEYANGGDLRHLIGVADTPELLVALLQIASALDYVHAQRIVHRDLKPENVLLFKGSDGARVAKLADFGIAWLDPALARPMTQVGKLMGTVDFISPEQVRGEPADPRSDLYALGVLAFELFTERVPFEGSMWQVLQARVTGPAPSLATFFPGAPEGLVALVDGLLATDPRDRPQSAHLVCADLARVLARAAPDGLAERVLAGLPAPTGAFLYRPPVVGRERDVAALVADVERGLASHEAPRAFGVVADAGQGKTTFVQAVQRRLTERGALCLEHVLRGEGAPFSPFQDIERDLARLGGERISRGAPTLPAMPATTSGDGSWVVARRLHETAEREVVAQRFLASDDAAAWRRRRVRRVLELARAASPPEGLVLVVEDVHEMDAGAWALLGDLLDALARTPIARLVLVLSARPSAAERLAALADRGLVTRALGDLDEVAVTQTIAAMLGTGTGGLPDGLVRQTLAECRGNPLLVSSYLRALVGSGELRRVRGGWALGASGRRVRVPTQMANILRDRLGLLTPPTRELLGVAAAIGPTFDVPLVLAAAGVSQDHALDALDEALRAGVLEPVAADGDAEILAFTHKRLAEVSYEDLAAPRRVACHDRIGAALLARGETSTATLARHFGAGSDDALAITWLRAAAEDALAAHDHASVELHLGRLVTRLDARGEPSVIERELLADALLAQGRGVEARDALVVLGLGATTDRLARARWLRKEGHARFLANDTAGGIRALEAALATLGDRVPRGRLGVRWRIVRELAAARLTRGRIHVGPIDPRLEERMSCHRWLGTIFRWVDLERVAAHSSAQLRLAERTGDVGHRTYGYAAHAIFWAFLAAPRRAARWFEASRRLVDARHDEGARAFVEVMHGGATLLGEDAASSMGHFDEAVRLARRVGDRFLEVLTLSGRAWAAMLLGGWRQSDEDFASALATADALDIRWLQADAGVGRSLVQVAMGHHTEGVARARALAEDEALGLPAIRALATEILGGAEYLRGRYKEAAALLEDATRQYRAHRLETGWGYLAHIEHAEALLWQVDRDGQATVPDLVPRLKKDLAHARRVLGKVPIFRGFDDILAGVVAARRGRRERALALFERGRARRIAPRESYLDTWLTMRVAVERLRLGAPRAEAQRDLDKVGEVFTANGLRGMLAWLTQMRAELGL